MVEKSLSFQGSKIIDWRSQVATKEEQREVLQCLLSIVNFDQPKVIDKLTKAPLLNRQVADLAKWYKRLRISNGRDQIGKSAVKFFVAQAIATKTMQLKALDASYDYGSGVNELMEHGADGLYEVGINQFEKLRLSALHLANWLKENGHKRPLFIESPLGNSLPVQVMLKIACNAGLNPTVYTWSAPRNDRSSRGQTLSGSTKEMGETAANFDIVVFVDDVSTGTRFLKIHKVLCNVLGEERFVAIALAVTPPADRKCENRSKLSLRLENQSKKIGFKFFWADLPDLPLFKLDDGPNCKWDKPLVWEDSDLIAGKRKINLIFTLIDHIFDIVKDLASEKSIFRGPLENAWARDVSGQEFVIEPGITRSVFKGINASLEKYDIRNIMEVAAKSEFEKDYSGKILPISNTEEFVKDRWNWLQNTFVREVEQKTSSGIAWTAFNAFACVFEVSLDDHQPRPNRDHSASPYFLPYNLSILSLNRRLCSLIVKDVQN